MKCRCGRQMFELLDYYGYYFAYCKHCGRVFEQVEDTKDIMWHEHDSVHLIDELQLHGFEK